MQNDRYESPLSHRYASAEMGHLFSSQFRHTTWRKLWIALAEAQQELGLPITSEQVQELKTHQDQIDLAAVKQHEAKLRHDVMAHIHAYGDLCPKARPIIHLGATSAFVTDNGDLIALQEGLKIVQGKLVQVIRQLSEFAERHANLACLGFTHLQPAQLTTVGKRACLWIQDLLSDQDEVDRRSTNMKFLGAKGTTGTQASFLALFDGDHSKVEALDQRIATKMGFHNLYPIAGQTYTRKLDCQIFDTLAGIAVSAHKFATDLRLLAHLKEIEEPFEAAQVGSSAMPYKRNPILSERICSLARFAISLNENARYTAALQWLERTLDDSANRRISLPEIFLATDAILNLMIHVTTKLVVYPSVIVKHIKEELPFMATENILMHCVKKGGDRQLLHEKLRQHSQAAGQRVKDNGEANDLLERILGDPSFALTRKDLDELMNLKAFVGRAPEQVHAFLKDYVKPSLEIHKNLKIYSVKIEL